jgi:succinate-semialdehyde dehydrogenase/glutarate-semialdehyde dehydrogenase
MSIQTINPTTGQPIKDYPLLDSEEISRRLEASHLAFRDWRQVRFSKRAKHMHELGDVLLDRKDELAALITEEMGKPLQQSASEIEKCAWACKYYADHAEELLSPQSVDTGKRRSFVSFEPLGVIFAIMPWNFPFWQVFRFAAPHIMAGNAGVLKHSPNVTGCALAMEELFLDAGFPDDLFSTFVIDTAQASAVIKHPYVRAVTLTGSVGAGRAVASQAGQMLKKTVLELGGSDPYVVLEDANIEAAAKTCVHGRLINSGQSCIAAKRFIVVESVREEFEKIVVEELKAAKMGDPTEDGVTIGPMAREDLRDKLAGQVKASIDKGAKCVLGGEVPNQPGFFYPPTLLTNVTKDMPAYEEEMFGPVASIIEAAGEAEAIGIANDSEFGLGAAVFTSDPVRGERIATEALHAGSCFVNDFVKSDPRLPFGGVKDSGYGRELAAFGIHEFVNIKTVSIG